MVKLKIVALAIASSLLVSCSSMSFGETALDTLGTFIEASDIKDCYERGGTLEYCEGWR